jgi:hypothetical protein
MFLDRLKALIKTISSTALAILALYAVVVLFSSAAQALGGPALAVPLLQNTLVDDASVPLLINYQGTLRDTEGEPLSGYYTMTFRLYDDIIALPDAAVWSEQHISVTVRSGLFSVLLGDSQPFGATFFNSPDRFIGVTVDPYDEMVPRQRFASVPYAIYADRAYSLSAADGDPQDAVYVDDGGRVGIGTANPAAQLNISGQEADAWASGLSLQRSDGGEGRLMADPQGLKFRTMEDGDAFFFQNAANATTLKILDNGNVGIGVGNPGSRLTILGPEEGVLRLNNSNGDSYMTFDGNEIDTYNSGLLLNRNSTTNVSIAGGGGDVLIGTSGSSLSVRGALNVAGNITVDNVKPVLIRRFENLPNNGDTNTGISANNYECVATSWSADYDINEGGAHFNQIWTHVVGSTWYIDAHLSSEGNDENPDVDVLCFRKDIAEWVGASRSLNDPD